MHIGSSSRVWRFGMLASVLLLAACQMPVQPVPKSDADITMSLPTARRVAVANVINVETGEKTDNFLISRRGFGYTWHNEDGSTGHPYITFKGKSYVGVFVDADGLYRLTAETNPPFTVVYPKGGSNPGYEDQTRAQNFANALNRLLKYANVDYPPFKAKIDDGVAKCVAGTARPAASDALHAEMVLGLNALDEKRLTDALDHYDAALSIEACEPDANKNAGLISAELQDWGSASDYMRRYLLLVPNAPDAAQMKNNIIVWDDKAKQ